MAKEFTMINFHYGTGCLNSQIAFIDGKVTNRYAIERALKRYLKQGILQRTLEIEEIYYTTNEDEISPDLDVDLNEYYVSY